jgi:ABC-type antimicrobial peptide transport system permease subunit/class 3 adenylate cyclase
MFFLALHNLRARPGRTTFTAFAIALGVALILAARIAGVTAEAVNMQARSDRLAGADLEITHSSGVNFSEHVVQQLAESPQVAAARPILRWRSTNPGLALVGVDAAQPIRAYQLAAGTFLSASDAVEILIPVGWAAVNGLGVGDLLSIPLGDQPRQYRVVGLLKEDGLPSSVPTIWMPLQTMRAALAAPQEASAILVQLKPGTPIAAARDDLQTALGSAYIVTSATTGLGAQDAVESLIGAALPFASLVVLLAGAFFIYNAFRISLTERRREIGQLRALGMTRAQVIQLTLIEALLVAGLGCVLGLLLGGVFGSLMTASVRVGQVGIPLDGVILAVGVGLGVTVGVVLNLALQAGRISPLMALRVYANPVAGGQRSRWAGWAALFFLLLFGLLQAAMLQYLQNPANITQAFLMSLLPPFALGAAVLAGMPLWMRGAFFVARRTYFSQGVISRLALDTQARQPDRATLTTVTLTISLMLVISLDGTTRGMITSGVENFVPVFGAYDVALGRTSDSGAIAPPLPAGLQADLKTLTANARLIRYGSIPTPNPEDGFFGLVSPNPVFVGDLAFFNRSAVFRPVEGSWQEAEQYFAAGPAIIIPEIASRRLNLQPGDTVRVDTFEGQTDFTVAMVSQHFILTSEVGERYFHAYPTILFFSADQGANLEALREQASLVARSHNLEIVTDPPRFFEGTINTFFGSLFALFGGLTSISGIVAGLGIANTLFASVMERQSELGALRALGFTRAQVRQMVVFEAGWLGLIGSVIGVLGGLGMSLATLQLLNTALALSGFVPPETPPLPWGMAAFALIAGPVLAMLAALWPADRAVAINPALAMRAEGAAGFSKPAKEMGPTGLSGLAARLPLAVKLSITTGLLLVVTMGVLTGVRLHYEQQLLEENVRAIFARATEIIVNSAENQLGADVSKLTPELARSMFSQTGDQADAINQLFQRGDSPYAFTLEYMMVTDTQHKILLSNRAEYNNQIITDTVYLAGETSYVRLTDWTGVRAFEATIALHNQGGDALGFLVVGVSTEPVDHITSQIVQSSVMMMGVALLAAIIITVFFTRRALAPIAEVVTAAHRVARGDLTQYVPEKRWDDVGQLARAFNEMLRSLNDREHLRDLFGRYPSREVSQAVLAGGVSLRGKRKTITCLYVDMHGSTAFSEKVEPEEVMAALNHYFEVIVQAVEAHGGVVNRFVGDEAVCVFGAPTPYHDHAERAVSAALAIRQGLAQLNAQRSTLHLPVLSFGMGISSGEVVAGATGSAERQEYTVIGNAMNIGARVQALTRQFDGQDIILSEFTVQALKRPYPLIDLGEVEIRGKSGTLHIYGLGYVTDQLDLRNAGGDENDHARDKTT